MNIKTNEMKLEPTIKEMDEMVVVGLECHTSMTEMQKNNPIHGLWMDFMSLENSIPFRKDKNVTYGVCYDENKETGDFVYAAAVEVEKVDQLSDKLVTKTIPAQRYLVFTHKGLISELGKTFGYIFEDWLPQSNYEVVNSASFELYGERFLGPDNDQSETDIYIPIK
ncbi:GyrI-like domain-containing protein [Cytobacillus sp. Hm23]